MSHQEYVEAVLAAPHDDEPRLAYARFLRPSDPDRSAFIEAQIQRVRTQRAAQDPDTEQMPPAERSILARSGEHWVRELGRFTSRAAPSRPRIRFYRGFVEYALTDVEKFITLGPALRRNAPVRHADFAPMSRAELDRLLRDPQLSTLDSIGFPSAGLDDDAVAAIAGCPHLSGCRRRPATSSSPRS